MKYLSVCSGIEAATVAWAPLGWEPIAFSEISAFPSAVLAHYHPDVPNLGDMTKFQEWPDARIDVLVGGTPCQSFSVAGLRAGLDDPRGSLMLVYLAIARRYRPRWLVWENVPGVLSSDDGRAFGSLLGGLGELGYGFAYRVLDAQYFGLAQRRKRVFVVGHLGTEWRRAAAVLFERESLSGHPPPRRQTRKDLTAGALRSTDGGSDVDHVRAGHVVCGYVPEIVPQAMSAKWSKGSSGPAGDDEIRDLVAGRPDAAMAFKASHYTRGKDGAPSDVAPPLSADADKGDQDTLIADVANTPAIAFTAKDYGGDAEEDLSPTLRSGGFDKSHASGGVMPAIAYGIRSDAARDGQAIKPSADAEGRVRLRDPGFNVYEEIAPTLDAGQPHSVGSVMSVRRLTPRECERLQGFPDDYTLIPYRGKPASDGPRYMALGNSMAVPVMRWIGERIAMVDGIE